MKKIRKLTAVLLAAVMLMTISSVSAGAMTVVRDGKEYTLETHTPTTGDVYVLMVRLGFADYEVDDAKNPAVSEQTLLSYFDGSEDSVNAYYEVSSYGQFHLHCDEVFTYTAPLVRAEYDSENRSASSSPEGLIEESLTSLKDQIDFDKYDSNNDGYLDVVCFNYAGPMGAWGTTWWPYVDSADITVENKKIEKYAFLKDSAGTMKHEFGHIFGAPDYYSFSNTHEAAIATFDMMCNSSSDHNGFTKWLFGWLSNDDIAYVSLATGDTTVSLAPFETSLGDGKKIAVVAPAIDEQTPLLSEYFIVEYDTGTANNKQTFENYRYSPGFRIFHVNAKAGYDDTELYAHLLSSNNSLRLNLIHNVKNEMKDPDGWVFQDMFFREGDSLTPLDYQNTGLTVDNIYNGSFTGISFTDFVTGDNPSFRVSFSDEQVHQPDPTLSLTVDSLNADVRMTIDSDKPIVQRSRHSEKYEEPYLIDSAGNKLTLDVMPIENSVFSYKLSYTKNNPPVSPETEYTLVIPEGYFITGYAQDVPEFRQTLTTEKFLGLTFLEYYALDHDRCVSNIFAASDNSYGRIELFADSRKAEFTEYNLSGKAVFRNTFDIPDVLGEEERPLSCRVFRLNDGNYSLCITTGVTNYFIKIDRYGKALSEIFTLGDDAVDIYIQNVSRIEFEPYKNGICKLMKSSREKSAVLLTIDFENAPKITPVNYFEAYFPLDSNSYLRRQFTENDIHLYLYNSSDEVVADIILDDSFMGAYTENGNIKILFKHTEMTADFKSIKSYYFAIYDSSGSLLAKEDLSDSAAENLKNYYTNSIVCTDSGYYLSYNEWGSKETKVYVFDSDWNMLGEFKSDSKTTMLFTGNSGIVIRSQKIADDDVPSFSVSRFSLVEPEIIPTPVLGDANGDGKVNILDVTAIQRKLAEYDVPDLNELAADIDGSGLNANDATLIQKYLADFDTEYTIGEKVE